MKKLLVVLSAGALAVVATGVLRAQKAATGKRVIYVSSSSAAFKRSTSKGVTMEVLWGDPDKGAHACG